MMILSLWKRTEYLNWLRCVSSNVLALSRNRKQYKTGLITKPVKKCRVSACVVVSDVTRPSKTTSYHSRHAEKCDSGTPSLLLHHTHLPLLRWRRIRVFRRF